MENITKTEVEHGGTRVGYSILGADYHSRPANKKHLLRASLGTIILNVGLKFNFSRYIILSPAATAEHILFLSSAKA